MMSFSRQLPEVFLGTRDKKNGEFMLFPSQQDDSSDDEKPTALGKLKCKFNISTLDGKRSLLHLITFDNWNHVGI